MKNSFKIGFVALALSFSVAACHSKSSTNGGDTSATKTDTVTKDTTVKTDTSKADSTIKKDTTVKTVTKSATSSKK